MDKLGVSQYRLTARGWLAAVELSGVANSVPYKERLARLLATMKAHVDGAAIPDNRVAAVGNRVE